MGSIPLPALHIQPPEQQDPLRGLQTLMAIKSLSNQQQLQRQDIEAKSQENQLLQQRVKDQQLVQSHLQSNPNATFSEAAEALRGKISMGTYTTLKDTDASIRQKNATASKDELDNLQKQHDQYQQIYSNIANLPDEELAAKTPEIAQVVNSVGGHFQIDPSKPLTKDTLKSYGSVLGLNENYLKQEADKRKESAATTESTAKTAEAEASTQKTQLETEMMKKYGGNTQMQEARYTAIQTKKNLGQSLSPEEAAFSKSFERLKTLNTQFQFNLQNAGGASGANGKPSAIAQGIADGSMKWSDAVSARTPMSVKAAILSEVKQINPQFNSGDFALEQSVKKEFTSGDAAKNLTAFNTAIEHANQLRSAADYLDNGNTIALNKIGNALGYQFGSDKTTNFNVIKSALSGEISKVFKGGQATDAEIREVQKPFDSANSHAQLKGAIDNAVKLMNSKRDALKQQYASGVQGKPNFGGSGSDIAVKAPNGKTYTFKDQASAEAFKQKAGIQ